MGCLVSCFKKQKYQKIEDNYKTYYSDYDDGEWRRISEFIYHNNDTTPPHHDENHDGYQNDFHSPH